jgi:hypothetical protein
MKSTAQRFFGALTPLAVFAHACVALANPQPNYDLANELGLVIAAEEVCSLQYKQAAIEKFIAENVRADDLSFPDILETAITLDKNTTIPNLGGSQKVVLCAQIRRIAKSYRFVD